MYLRHLHVRNVKLLRDVEIDFCGADGRPRMWTVFVGENRLCKTTLLQTIAAAAAGVDRGTQLVTDVVASWPDLRNPVPLSVDATFGFSERRHGLRSYPTYPASSLQDSPPTLHSKLELQPDKRVFTGSSGYVGEPPGPDPLTETRSLGIPDWFVAGYGPSRLLPSSGMTRRQVDPSTDRLRSLFGEPLIGTGFIEILGEELGRAFAKVLQSVLVDGGLLPHVTALELRGRHGIRSSRDLVEAQRFEMDLLDADGKRIRVPAIWLSQGYQTLIAWLADLVGQILLESGGPVEAADMEGIVLVDELDLHLHPTWQLRLIPALKQVFPRLQFIATTHSAMVLPALSADEVIMLSPDEQGSVIATPSSRSPALLTATELLDAFFEIQRLHPGELGAKTRRYGLLATDPTRTAEEHAQMIALRRELEVAGLEFDWEPVPREDVP
ncbi:MAG: AAA family ATPase [Nannocystaceae bacterium]